MATSDANETAAADSSSGSAQDPCTVTAEAARDCVEKDRYVEDLTFIADVRAPGSAHWQEVQDLCADRLTDLGYEVDLFEYGSGVNVVGRKVGTTAAEEIVVIGAHYDHIPDCVGADDNATGVAGVLEIARVLADGSFPRTLMVACWDEEEQGLLGSIAFVQWAVASAADIAIYFNFDMIGFASDEPDSQAFPPGIDLLFPTQLAEVEANDNRADFVVAIADEYAHDQMVSLEMHANAVGLPNLVGQLSATLKNEDLVADLRRSDHAPFWVADFPAIFLSDSANFRNGAYHCLNGEDTLDTLDHDFATGVVQATVGAVVDALNGL
ncbi:MAG: M20/M25/M40 family metallo-hydrolase [Nannocystaceae bacterium]|nr:M20/M25/M40 family metallo-hydrolase [Nannocystaceae bacterium]